MKYPGTNFDVRVGDIAKGVIDAGQPEIFQIVGIVTGMNEDKGIVFINFGMVHISAVYGGASYPNTSLRTVELSSLNRILESGPQQV